MYRMVQVCEENSEDEWDEWEKELEKEIEELTNTLRVQVPGMVFDCRNSHAKNIFFTLSNYVSIGVSTRISSWAVGI